MFTNVISTLNIVGVKSVTVDHPIHRSIISDDTKLGDSLTIYARTSPDFYQTHLA
jgi:hypothetical protein